jgi:hypothetical protein
MSGDASRFTYVATTGNDNNIRQLATLEIDPPSLGEAPAVYDPQISPSYILTGARSTATVSTTVSTSNTVLRVASAVLRDGLKDVDVYAPVLLPDGTGRYIGPNVYTQIAPVGPRTVRIKAEVSAADGKAHATEIEFAPFEVHETVPTYQLTVTKSGTGVGDVTTDKGFLTWTGPTGTAQYYDSTPVALSAGAGACSSFITWAGACNGTVTPCNLVMNQALSVTAYFDLLAEVRNQRTLATYGSIQIALNEAAASSDTLVARAASFEEDILFGSFGSHGVVTLIGGSDCSYQPTQQMTTIIGSLTIAYGSLNIERITIR